MKKIPLTQGKYAIIDDEDYNYLSQFKWHYDKKAGKLEYAKRCAWDKLKKLEKGVLMHREILGSQKGEVTDHVNGNGLDNRKENLRICTQSQNCMNRRARASGTKGLTWNKKAQKWQVYILNKYLGIFQDKEEAIAVYNEQAKKLFGEFARLN